MVKVSAPGKLILFGEHAVVYGRPCIVLAVNHRMSVEIGKRNDEKIIINAPEVNVNNYSISLNDLNKEQPKETRFVLMAVRNFFDKYGIKSGLDIKTKSEFSSKFGFGSSSATTVCTIKALAELFGIKISEKELFNLSYKTVLDIQGVGSGFDVAAAIYGRGLYFVTGGKTIEPINIDEIPLVVGYTGIKADTPSLVKIVEEKLRANPEEINNIFDKMKDIVETGKKEIQNRNWERIGELMNENQGLLRALDVSSVELERLIAASTGAGAYGAKLSGAGRGDCMIAVVPQEKHEAVKKAIEKAGGEVIPVKTGVEGIRIEEY